MNGSPTLQYNYRQSDALINAYSYTDDPQELEEDMGLKLDIIGNLAAKSASVAATLNATAVAAGILKAQPVSSGSAPAQQSSGGAPAPACEHGTKSYRTGTGKNGKAWAGWDCPANVCPRQWVNTR